MSEEDDWGITPDYKNVMTEKEQRFGAQAVPGRVGHIDMNELRQNVIKSDAESKKNAVPKASYGYGGAFGVEKDRMDKSAVGADYHSEVAKHSSQQDYAKGFGGRYGVQSDRQDKNAVGYGHHEEVAKHASQTDYAIGFGGKYGVQKDRVDSSSFGYNKQEETNSQPESGKRTDFVSGEHRASELRARFEKLALDQNKPVERPPRPSVGKLKPNIFPQSAPSTAEPKPAPMPTRTPPAAAKPAAEPEPSKSEPATTIAREPSPEPLKEKEPEAKPEAPEPEPPRQPEPEPEQPKPAETTDTRTAAAATATTTAVAAFDFTASHDDELSFKEGEKIVDIVKVDTLWWSGRIGDRTGIFPANYVEEVTSPSDITAMALYDFAASQDDELSFKAGDEICDINKFDEAWWSGRIGNRVGIFPANYVSEN
uniref:SH3 domain-containing protein n=1 Tax=Mesocestoides corti TaxID=53468 RepID=A0A5K3F927_MESCO